MPRQTPKQIASRFFTKYTYAECRTMAGALSSTQKHERLVEALKEYAAQEVSAQSQDGVLQLDRLVRKTKDGKAFICTLSDGNALISTQGNTVEQVLENLADAYRAVKAENE